MMIISDRLSFSINTASDHYASTEKFVWLWLKLTATVCNKEYKTKDRTDSNWVLPSRPISSHRRRLHRGNRELRPGTHARTGANVAFCPGTFHGCALIF